MDGNSSELESVSISRDGGAYTTNAFCYSHVEGTSLVSGMTNGAGFGWSRSYEPGRNLITAVSNFWNAAAVSSFGYGNDALGRRTLRIDAAPSLSATNTFAYNQRSEVTNAIMDAVTYAYSYDGIGNRQTSSVGVVASAYTANSLNQYTAIAGGLSRTPGYDLDGNMTWDGKFSHTWDAENRLVKSEPGGFATNGTLLVESSYDYQNRRVKKADKRLSGRGAGYPFDPSQPGTWDTVETRHFVWDGWNIAAEIVIDSLTGSTNIHYYTWGLDLSGSIQGAGGVGGLLADTKVSSPSFDTYYPCYDVNGNITEYVDSTGSVRGHFMYSAFGEIIAQSGDLAETFTHRFSTKPFDIETKHIVFQLRQYTLRMECWMSRDPANENGGHNLYRFVDNSAISFADVIGLVKGRFGGPTAAPTVWTHRSEAIYGAVWAPREPSDNQCSCECKNGRPPIKLTCTLSFIYTMSFLHKDEPLWLKAPPAFPSEPSPPDWDTWSFRSKKAFIKSHEDKHVAHYRSWYNSRRERLAVFEQLRYPSMSNCQLRADKLVDENLKAYKKVYADEKTHSSWR